MALVQIKYVDVKYVKKCDKGWNGELSIYYNYCNTVCEMVKCHSKVDCDKDVLYKPYQ